MRFAAIGRYGDTPPYRYLDPGLDDLTEVDQLFSQVPLPEDFELEPVATMVPGSTDAMVPGSTDAMVPGSTDATDQTHVIADAGPSNQRFGPLVGESDISKLQKAAVPANTKKNTNWALNEWANYNIRHRNVTLA